MQTPLNPFKQALRDRRPQIGFWLGLASHYSTEICAGAGFDWLLIDGEHSPNDLRTILQQAQAIAAYPATHAIARVPVGHGNIGTALIKQYLDLGIQTILVPMVDTAEQAQALVRAMRYPPGGIRGMGGARASRWGRIANYAKEANDHVCLLVQAEGVDQELLVAARHAARQAHRDVVVDHLGPAERVEHAVARGQLHARGPLVRMHRRFRHRIHSKTSALRAAVL